ncbi:MAG: hypothetical protein KGH50_03540 [Candidatus Micrarchaeota archaeon]|nr:hypothetical protein [Candidatus Micrarchaeota archaeon]
MSARQFNKLIATSAAAGIIAIELNDYRGMFNRLKGAFRNGEPNAIDSAIVDLEKKGRAITFYTEMLDLNGKIAKARKAFSKSMHNAQYFGYNPYWVDLKDLERQRNRLIKMGQRRGYFALLAEMIVDVAQEAKRA